MKKLYFSPCFPRGKAANPYCDNFRDSVSSYFYIIPASKYSLPRGLDLLRRAFVADFFILNWLEGVVHLKGGTIQAVLGVVALFIIRLRKKRVLWMFHNIHPHGGETFWSMVIQRLLFKWSYLIVSHSQEAADYARQYAKCPVVFKHHPVLKKKYGAWNGNTRECDIFIWGDIYPYKGIVEFLNNETIKQSHLKIYILGKAINNEIQIKIEESLSECVVYENRRADFDEIAAQCMKAKYVLFPYIGDSVSSSGVLMDTLLMGGIPIGPNRGAFVDLQKKGCCLTYNRIEEVVDLISTTNDKNISKENVETFINENSWNSFGEWVSHKII